MLRPKHFALILAALFATAANAQSPTDGHVAGHSYVNNYFHFAYTWPAMLKVASVPGAAADANNPHAYEYLLFMARQGDQPYGVAVVAERLNVSGPHSSGVTSSAGLVDRLAQSLRPGPILSDISRSQTRSARGIVFDKLSYLQNGKPSSVLATQVGQYAIVFKCNADSRPGIQALENSVLALRLFK